MWCWNSFIFFFKFQMRQGNTSRRTSSSFNLWRGNKLDNETLHLMIFILLYVEVSFCCVLIVMLFTCRYVYRKYSHRLKTIKKKTSRRTAYDSNIEREPIMKENTSIELTSGSSSSSEDLHEKKKNNILPSQVISKVEWNVNAKLPSHRFESMWSSHCPM